MDAYGSYSSMTVSGLHLLGCQTWDGDGAGWDGWDVEDKRG